MSTASVGSVLGAIEGELRALWESPDENTGLAKVRTSTLNLIVVARADRAKALCDRTDELAETHAGRVVLLLVDDAVTEGPLSYGVSGVCRPSRSGFEPICNDRVELRLPTHLAERAPSIVRSLRLTEVPTICEIDEGAGAIPDAMLRGLAGSVDRVIVDSSSSSFERIDRLVLEQAARVVDRQFARIHPWRDLIARFFDDHPTAAERIERIRITRTEPDGDKPDVADLLLGWMVSRLRLTIDGGRCVGPNGPVVFEMTSVGETSGGSSGTSGSPSGELWAVEVEASLPDAAGRLRGRLERRAGDTVHWSRVVSGPQGNVATEHELSLGHHDEAWLLTKLLDPGPGDVVCRDALVAAATLSRGRS